MAEPDPQARIPADADEHKGEEGKFDKYFSASPGQGD
jgi:ferredoxin